MRPNTERTFQSLQSFQSVDELNASLSAMRSSQAFRELTPTAQRVFDVLARYSCRYPGVSYRTKNNIADELDVSRRTVIRAVQQLEAAGFVKQYELKRATGDRRRTSNAIVFQPFGERVTTECHGKKPATKRKNIKHTRDTYKTEKQPSQSAIIHKGLVAHLPSVLQHTLAPFLATDALFKAVGTVYRAKASVSPSMRLETHEDSFRQAISGVISAYKRGKVRDLFACLYATVRGLAKSLHIRGLFADAVGLPADVN